jgi:iron complex outermembrane receptor protein
MATKNWDALCPKFSIEYILNGKNRVYFSAAKGFSAPILDDLCRTGRKKSGFRIANPDLKPELLTNFESGFDMFVRKKLQVATSIYYSIGKDFLYYLSTGDSVNMGYMIAPVIQRANISEVQIYGAEIELKYDFTDSISFFISYSYAHAEIKNQIINNPLVDKNLTGKQLTDLPNHKISAGIIWNNKVVNTTLLFKYIGETWINEENVIDSVYYQTDKLPAYGIWSIRFDRRVYRSLFAFFSIEDIFNTIFVTTDAQRSPGRFFSGGFKYSF